ncbi:MAG: SHOCT domain-containing protein [Candidatus Pacearchaeota archaeon]|jgi:putative membrane protein
MPMGQYLAHATGMYGYGWLFEILILIVFFIIVYWIVKSSQKNESASDILNRRYAKGEISKKQYLELKKEILGK